MRPLARSRLVWWDSFVSALMVLGAIVSFGLLWLLAKWCGL